jgi:endosialidase-like protein
MTIPYVRKSIRRSPLRLGFLLFPLTLGCFALSPTARAVAPALPGSCSLNADGGCHALYDLTTGIGNTAFGSHALAENTDASFSTGIGAGALFSNNGESNTAVGAAALLLNTTGSPNTAVGTSALLSNDSGSLNTAVGNQALLSNVSGLENTAMGDQALLNNVGSFNVAVGGAALITNTGGNDNTAVGGGALNDTTGSDNTALGFQAGILATDGDGNVYIGAGMSGAAGESNQTYIRNINTTSVSGAGTDTVTVNLSTGLLGHVTSSRRYKDDIKAMDNASQTLFALKPVTFRYKKQIDQNQTLDYGLIAEEVAKVDSNLAIRDKNGQIESVRYSAINAMLLNEFLKGHKAFLEEQRKVQEQGATIARMEQQLDALTAGLQKVSAQLELSKAAPQTALNRQ